VRRHCTFFLALSVRNASRRRQRCEQSNNMCLHSRRLSPIRFDSHRPMPTRRNSTVQLHRVGRCELVIKRAMLKITTTHQRKLETMTQPIALNIFLIYHRASLFRRFTDTDVYLTCSVKIQKTRHKITVDIRIFLQCTSDASSNNRNDGFLMSKI